MAGRIPSTVLIQGREVALTVSPDAAPPHGEDWPAAIQSFPPFEQWVASFQEEAEFVVMQVLVQHLEMFSEEASARGPALKRVGRAKIAAHVCNSRGVTQVCTFVFRGPSAVCLLLLRALGCDHVVVVTQPRVAPASCAIAELPGGFVGADGAFCGRAADGLRRALPGLTLAANASVELTGVVHREAPRVRGIATVPMGSDEQVRVVMVRSEVTPQRLGELTAALRRARAAPLRFDVVPLLDMPQRSTDARTLAACYLCQKLAEVEGPAATRPPL
eukprot:TRINITY_DN27500_c0_g1_i1.p1 TRINITY_DN27500_c0_g1~~TRINITY_DN27500_c0_g1_i1.p1  ORF type:complete len:275 (+),score=88.82 TRINITY_DN27500_c0_g1_i1:88-912(+)